MSTPLDVRNRRREAQRTTRLALNAVNRSLDSWKAAIGDGKRQATDLTNAVLTMYHLPSLPLGVLHDVPDLQQRAATKLVEKQQRLLLGLQESLETLSQAVQGLEDAAASVEEVAAKEAAAPVLGQQPVFTALPLPTIASMLRELHAMHASELHVKGVVVDGLAVVCWQAAQEGIAGRHSGSGSGGGRAAVRAQDAVEAKLQVHITAWMLCAEVQAARVTDNLALLTSDCSA